MQSGEQRAPDAQDRERALRERIRGNFDRGAAAYSQLERRVSFFAGLARHLLALAPSLEGRRLLDVGCGSGASLGVLREATGPGGAVFGLDVSLGMLREAKRQLGDAAQVVAADGCRFDTAFRTRFDGVIYNAVLFLLPNAAASLESASRVLAPGGHVLISSLEGVFVGHDRRPLADVLAERGHSPGRHALSPWGAVTPTLERLFEAPTVERRAFPYTPADFLAFYGLEPMSAGLLPSLPYPERKAVLDDLAQEFERTGTTLEQVWLLAAARTQGERAR